MPFSLFGFFHRWTGVFLPRSGDNAEASGKGRNPVGFLGGHPGKTSGKQPEYETDNLSGREWELLCILTFELDFFSKPHYNERKVPAFSGKRNTGGKRDFYEGLPQMRQALFRRRE